MVAIVKTSERSFSFSAVLVVGIRMQLFGFQTSVFNIPTEVKCGTHSLIFLHHFYGIMDQLVPCMTATAQRKCPPLTARQ